MMIQKINHKNGFEKWNNNITNLEWVTDSENKHHVYRTGIKPKGEKSHLAKYTDEQIIHVCELLIEDLKPPREISQITGVSVGAIHDIKNHGCRTDITEKYDFSNCHNKNQKYSDEKIENIYKMLDDKIPCKEISKKIDIPISIVYYYKEKRNKKGK